MPTYFSAINKAGIKVTTVYPENSGSKYHVHQGVVLLFETEYGTLQAIVDAAEITTIRTGAASGLATRLLANKGAGQLAIIGAGTQGSCHLEAMKIVRDIRSVKVYDYIPEKAMQFVRRESEKYNFTIEAVDTVEKAVRSADIICIATPSREPVIEGRWLSPGVHINSVGFGGPSCRELDMQVMVQSKIYVDYLETVMHDCGDIVIPLERGEIEQTSIFGSLGDLLLGEVPGRANENDITLFKSAGVAVQDLSAVDYIFKKALKQGLGTAVELGGYNLLEK